MATDDFLSKVRQHWVAVLLLIIAGAVALLLVGLVTMLVSNTGGSPLGSKSYAPSYNGAYEQSRAAMDYYVPPSPGSGGVAPQEQARKIERTASMTTEVERGEFDAAEDRLEGIVADSRGFILSQNVNTYEDARTGYYTLRVPQGAYNETVRRLQGIGEVKAFSENAADVTAQYTDVQIEILAEEERLTRYRALYSSYGGLNDKLQLEDRVFDQERRVDYLKQSLKQTGERVEYSTVSVTLQEEPSAWTDMGFVRLSDLTRTFVASLKGLLYTIAALLPWVVIGLLVWLGIWLARRKA